MTATFWYELIVLITVTEGEAQVIQITIHNKQLILQIEMYMTSVVPSARRFVLLIRTKAQSTMLKNTSIFALNFKCHFLMFINQVYIF